MESTRSFAPHAPHGTVIVVDDVEAMRDLIVVFLRRLGGELTLIGASNAHQALAMVESCGSLGLDRSYPIVVITDVRMPGPDGMSLLLSLATSPYDVDTIVMTAFGDEHLHDRARELGALACFDKPFDLEALGAAVVHALDGHARSRAPAGG